MKYICVRWIHSLPREPVALFSELDNARYEVRKLEISAMVPLVERLRTRVGQNVLGELPVPSLDTINSDSQFQAEEITQSEFEAAWSAYALPDSMQPSCAGGSSPLFVGAFGEA